MHIVDELVPHWTLANAAHAALRVLARLAHRSSNDPASLPPMSAEWLTEYEAAAGKHDVEGVR